MEKEKKQIQPTIAELQSKIVELEKSIKEWSEWNEYRKKEFAKVFEWYKPKGQYDFGNPDPIQPSWEMIFTHVGKLLANQVFADNHTEIHQIRYDIQQLQEKNSFLLDALNKKNILS